MKRGTRTAALAATMASAALLLGACSGSGEDAGEKAADEAAAGGGTTATSTTAPEGMPRPKPGKWKITMKIEGLPTTPPPTEVCYTPEMVSGDAWATGQRPPEIKCSDESTRREGDAVVAHSVCELMGRKTTTDVRFEGDFDSRYTMKTTSTTEPAIPGAPNPQVMTATVERLGDC